jgi:tetratricopeptide (TPR) repeat protein
VGSSLACGEKAEALTLKLKLPANILRRHQEAHILVLLALKRGQEALALTEKLLPDYEAKLLPDDPDRIFLLTLHAKALRVAGRPKEAVAAYESLFERLKNWPDEVHPIDILNAHLSYPIALRQAMNQEVATKLGIAEGQNSRTPETLLNWLTSLRDTLQGQHLGREQALEAYGFKVTIGTAAGRKTKAAKPQ